MGYSLWVEIVGDAKKNSIVDVRTKGHDICCHRVNDRSVRGEFSFGPEQNNGSDG